MLEIRGAYSKNETSEALHVLVQFDGAVLHVWHQADPFYYLLSSTDFSISYSRSEASGSIVLKRGGWIKSKDLENLKLIQEKFKATQGRKKRARKQGREAILVIALVLLFFVAWLVSRQGF